MGILNRKIRELENGDAQINLAKAASDKASDVIKELSGKGEFEAKKVPNNLIVFTNSAGGTGATTLATNVAYSMFTRNLKVLLIDLNITCPVVHTYLGIQQDIEKNDLVSYLLGKSQLSESIDTTKSINLLFANNRTLTDEINCNDSIAIENFRIMLKKVKQYYDVVIIDCPMRIDNMLQNVMLYEADAIYTVWDEGIGSIINTERLRRNMALSGIDSFTKMRVILNKRTSVHFSDYPLTKLNMELVGVLPFDVDIIDNSLKGQIFCQSGSSNSKNALEFTRKIDEISLKIMKIGGYVNN